MDYFLLEMRNTERFFSQEEIHSELQFRKFNLATVCRMDNGGPGERRQDYLKDIAIELGRQITETRLRQFLNGKQRINLKSIWLVE